MRFGSNFIADITKANGAKIFGSQQSSFFGDESNKSVFDGTGEMSRVVERGDQLMHIRSNPTPGGFVEGGIEAIWSWSCIASHQLDNGV